MSRAFVKENDDVEALPDRPVSPHPNYVTEDGLAKIEAELARVSAACASAQADADRSALAQVARDLRYWQQRRSSAEVVAAPADAAKVQFGSTVTVARDDGHRQTWRIVGEDEAEPANGTLSYWSPVARALIGRAVGDVVQAGNSAAEIVEIR
jgi:transcription elongation GreA/GreB family factor